MNCTEELGSTSEIFERLRLTSENFGGLRINIGSTSLFFERPRVNFGKTSDVLDYTWDILEDFKLISESFVSTSEKSSNGTPGEYNLGLIVVLLSNQNPVILLSVL